MSTPQQYSLTANKCSNDKRPRLDEPLLGTVKEKTFLKLVTLPAEIWEYIFCFVPPISLGLVLRVNRAFHGYLDSNQDGEGPPALSSNIVQPIKAEAIWLASRKRFFPEIPRSLHDMTEVAIWRLLRGSSCQICGKSSTASEPPSVENFWKNGPGSTGVRVIWPFGIRTCASCMKDVTKTVGNPIECHQIENLTACSYLLGNGAFVIV